MNISTDEISTGSNQKVLENINTSLVVTFIYLFMKMLFMYLTEREHEQESISRGSCSGRGKNQLPDEQGT